MQAMLDELAGQFDRMTPTAATALLREHYGVVAVALERLDTERDDSFRVTTPEGYLVLKVAHPGDDPLVIDLQTAAMRRATEHGLPAQRLISTTGGKATAVVDGRIARVFDWLAGDLLADRVPSQEQLFALGAQLGRLSQALARLPQQVIHNDFHPGNLLVDPAHPTFVVGILDFGDVVHTARVCDLGEAIAYLIPAAGSVWGAATAFIDGFNSIVPLREQERRLLPDLVAARLVMRSVIPLIVPQPRTDTRHYADKNLPLLHRVLEGTLWPARRPTSTRRIRLDSSRRAEISSNVARAQWARPTGCFTTTPCSSCAAAEPRSTTSTASSTSTRITTSRRSVMPTRAWSTPSQRRPRC